jgi:hypothetical protein
MEHDDKTPISGQYTANCLIVRDQCLDYNTCDTGELYAGIALRVAFFLVPSFTVALTCICRYNSHDPGAAPTHANTTLHQTTTNWLGESDECAMIRYPSPGS